MPQFDPAVFAPQIAWLAITFVLLYLVMSRIALPRVGDVLESRRDRRDHDLDRAAHLRDEAAAAQAAYEAALAEARAKAHALAQESHEAAAKEAASRLAALDASLATKIREAEGRIAQAKDQALAEIGAVALDATGAAVEKLIGATVDPARVQSAIDVAHKGRP